MKSQFWTFFFLTLVAVGFSCSASAEQTQPKDLPKEVTAAVIAARQDNFVPFHALNPSTALPYLKKYIADPNWNVKSEIIDIAAAAHTSEAVQVLAPMTADQSVSREAVNALYNSFDKSFLTKNGGKKLKSSLLIHLKQEGQYTQNRVVLLLSCFPEDANIIQTLTQLRRDLSSANVPNPAGVMFVDVALSELGQPEALARVQVTIKQGDLNLLPALLLDLKFVDNSATLKNLVPLLRDRRYTKNGIVTNVDPPILLIPPGEDPEAYRRAHPQPPPTPPRTQYWRVCDIDLLVLARKTGVDIGVPDVVTGIKGHNSLLIPRNYTDAELELAYEKLSDYFSRPRPQRR